VLAGDIRDFVGLIRLYESDVWRIAVSLLGDWGESESLVQQAFMDAYRHLDKYQLGTDFGVWMRTIARNRLRKAIRSMTREKLRLAAYRDILTERLRVEEPAHDDSDIYLAALRGCRDELPAEEATLLRLRYEKGMAFEAIAARRDMTAAAVQRAISRIRFRLRSCIEGQLNPT
jgi:RNA polymerase sigma-70 factor (ECF subfamily)